MSRSSTIPRDLRYSCDRSWEEMRPIENGRFCEGCQKLVIDFAGWSRDELQAWFHAGRAGCGRYEAHQLDPSLIPVDEIGRNVRRGLFATIAAFAIGSAQAQQVEPAAPTEQVDSLSAARARVMNLRAMADARNPKLVQETCPTVQPAPTRRVKKRTYLSWRFPFVHRYRPQRMGFF